MMRASVFILGLLYSLATAAPLPRCTIAVAGANGRVGSMVCRELLRKHKQVTVRALVRSASDPYNGYGKLSYEVGAEDGKMDIQAAWNMGENGIMGAQTVEFDPEIQGEYGLDRLEIRECELRYAKDVEDALGDVDAVVYCASAFNAYRQRLPDRLDDAASSIAKAGMNLFELRFGKALFGDAPSEDGSDEPRKEQSRGKTADVEGVEHAIAVLSSRRKRKAQLAALTGGGSGGSDSVGDVPPFVLLSSAGFLGYDEDSFSGEVRENEFGFRKRQAESSVRASDVPHVIVRAAVLDDVRGEEGLGVQAIADPDSASAAAVEEAVAAGDEAAAGAVGKKADDPDVKKRRIHPRDVAAYLVACLAGEASGASAGASGASGASGGAAASGDDISRVIAQLEREKLEAVQAQDFLKAGELLEEVNQLKAQREEGATAASDASASTAVAAADAGAADADEDDATSRTVEVWTYLEGKPFFVK